MPRRLKIASFNCENLFSRAKLLNLASRELTATLLEQVAVLEGLLEQSVYLPADKKAIVRLADELSPYIAIAENRLVDFLVPVDHGRDTERIACNLAAPYAHLLPQGRIEH